MQLLDLRGHYPALDFAGGSARYSLDDVDDPRDLKVREQGAAVLDQLGFGDCEPRNDGRSDFFAVHAVGNSKAYCFGDCRMALQGLIHFSGRNLLAATIDQLFDAADQSDV